MQTCLYMFNLMSNSQDLFLRNWHFWIIPVYSLESLSGPDVESFTSEITLQVPTQADLRHKLASLSSTCTDSVSQDTEAGEEEDDDEDEREQTGNRRFPLVQPDQEEVEVDATLPEREQQNQKIKNCESNSSSWICGGYATDCNRKWCN